MKTTNNLFFTVCAFFAVAFLCSSFPKSTVAQNTYNNDDIYYSPNQQATTQPAVGTMPTPSSVTTTQDGNTYVTNNYYGSTGSNTTDDTYVYMDDNDYDYYYTSRINRFNRPLSRFGYYSNYYMPNNYYYDNFAFGGGGYNNYWFASTPIISFNTPWLWFFNTAPYYNYYNNYAYYYPNRWNNWGWNSCNYHNNWNNGWGWNNWGYNNGYYPYGQQNNYYYYGDNGGYNGNNNGGGYTNNNDNNNNTNYGPRPGMGGGYTGSATQGGRPLPTNNGGNYPNGGKDSGANTNPTRPIVNDVPNNNNSNYTRPIITTDKKDYNKPNYQSTEVKENIYTRPTNTLNNANPTVIDNKNIKNNNNGTYTRPVQSPAENYQYNKPNYQSTEVKENIYTRPANNDAPATINNNTKGNTRPTTQSNEPKNQFKGNDKKGNSSIGGSSKGSNSNRGSSINRGGGGSSKPERSNSKGGGKKRD